MRALRRFVVMGLADADARIGELLAARPHAATDEYLARSAVVRTFDAVAGRLRAWWLTSITAGAQRAFVGEWCRLDWARRYESIAVLLLSAVIAHVLLTTVNGPRPGWFWLILPGLAATVAIVILSGLRTRRSH
jgi:hypothetical protein